MENPFVAFGHGYETGSYGRCTAFDGFTVIAAPLGGFDTASRESRVWRAPGASYGVTYDSHSIKLAVRDGERGLFILGHHGGGREVVALNTGPDWKAMRDAFLAMDERTLYAVLYSFWQTAANARLAAQTATAVKWRDAYLDGRIRKSRPRGGRFQVRIESEFERDMRTGKARPTSVEISVGTGEIRQAPTGEI
jgi:hypothetical protein